LENLTFLRLAHTNITDVGLKKIRRLKNLTTLDICNTTLTDEGMEYIGELQSLTTLDIPGKEITDDGLQHLVGLKNLRSLRIEEMGSFTERGLQDLRDAQPDLKIHRTRPGRSSLRGRRPILTQNPS